MLQKIARSLKRDANLPVAMRARKAAQFLAAAATAPLYLSSCTRVGARPRTVGRPIIENAGRIDIGTDLNLISRFAPVQLTTCAGGALEIGDDVLINFGTAITAQKLVKIGSHVSIGPYSIIGDTEIPADAVAGLPSAPEPRPVVVEDRVWLAGRVTVLPGVSIGAGSVVAAGSIVATDVPSGVLAGGVPARVLRSLADPPDV